MERTAMSTPSTETEEGKPGRMQAGEEKMPNAMCVPSTCLAMYTIDFISSASVDLEKGSRSEPHRRTSEIVDAIDPPLQERLSGASSLVDINEPPSEPSVESEDLPPSIHEAPRKTYPPLSFSVITSLVPGSLFGVLARLGLLAITTYDGESIFPLAWVQATGCFVMGFALGMREQIAE